jgi:hypothetical protein
MSLTQANKSVVQTNKSLKQANKSLSRTKKSLKESLKSLGKPSKSLGKILFLAPVRIALGNVISYGSSLKLYKMQAQTVLQQ